MLLLSGYFMREKKWNHSQAEASVKEQTFTLKSLCKYNSKLICLGDITKISKILFIETAFVAAKFVHFVVWYLSRKKMNKALSLIFRDIQFCVNHYQIIRSLLKLAFDTNGILLNPTLTRFKPHWACIESNGSDNWQSTSDFNLFFFYLNLIWLQIYNYFNQGAVAAPLEGVPVALG